MLQWVSYALGTACSAIVAVPAALYLFDPLRRRSATERDFKRIARLDTLPLGVPREFEVRDLRQDAWTLYPEETIGRVWLVRNGANDTPTEQTSVVALATVCPHLGCAIQLDSAGRSFVCPCHKAGFRTNGKRLSERELGRKNPAPRDMDPLECRVVLDTETEQWWVEVRFQKFKQGLTTRVAIA
jgi:nitrite reductase/ring-hydroxylating ferredoxin subunit